jgi:8-oxo-dGTP pyrophosphatase MutT (NUDIX family)
MSWGRRFRRRAARVVLLDPDGRVLLLRFEPPPGSAEPGYWYLPGGGVMPFEAIEAAARREVREETGIRDLALGPRIGERPDVSFLFRGRRIIQDEWYLAAFVPTAHVGSGRRGDGEERAVAAHRWWTTADLAASGDVVFPPGLDALVLAAAAWAAGAAKESEPA